MLLCLLRYNIGLLLPMSCAWKQKLCACNRNFSPIPAKYAWFCERMKTQTVMATQIFEVTEKAPSDNAEGGILAANRAFTRVLTELIAFLVRHLTT